MQMLAQGSDEGNLPGLSWVPGRVRAFVSQQQSSDLPIPHMGWNDLLPRAGSKLFSKGFDDAPEFYFLHSYFFEAQDKQDVAATANYGLNFDAVVSRGHIHGVQCHPEKSHHWGEQLLKNFVEL
jgi:glutamine amidotransferase